MNGKKLRLGLIGKDVSKSQSRSMHAFILQDFGVECAYEYFSVSPTELDSVMRRLLGDFDGFNVTIPYKRDVMGYLDELVGDALTFSAVNTVVTATRGGYNTDGLGFLLMCSAADIRVRGKKVLVLGGGGAGRSTAVALQQEGAEVYLYQRRREKLEEACKELGLLPADSAEQGGFDILVNCTGVGMHDSEGTSPVGAKAFAGAEVAIDLIYTPSQSEFLRLAAECGLTTCNGKAMLFYQAYYADCLFLGVSPDENRARELYQRYLCEERRKKI